MQFLKCLIVVMIAGIHGGDNPKRQKVSVIIIPIILDKKNLHKFQNY